MTAALLIRLAVTVSVALIAFGVGLASGPRDIGMLLRQPALLARSLLAMNVIMPLIAIATALVFALDRPVLVALVALAVSPIPPLLPRKELKAGGTTAYAVGLFAIAGLLSIVFVPLWVHLIGAIFDRPLRIAPAAVARAVFLSVLAPVIAGVLARRYLPGFATRIARPVAIVAMVLLVIGAIPIVVRVWPAFVALAGNYTLLAFVLFPLLGLGVGHLLGGPQRGDRTVLALSSAARHPGVAIAIVHANAPNDRLATAAILLCLVVSAVVCFPYVHWRRRTHAAHSSSKAR